MQYIIDRLDDDYRSIWGMDEPPCEGAFQRTIVHKQTGRAHKIDAEEFLAVGSNHSQSDDGYYLHRDVEVVVWFMDIDIVELQRLAEQYGGLIIRRYPHNPEYWCIKIYGENWKPSSLL